MTFASRTLGYSRNLITYTFGGDTSNVSFDVTSGSVPPGTGSSVVGTYVAGSTDVNIIIGNGVYIYSTVVTTPALTLTGGTGADKITLTNNGYIMGCGGKGGGSNGAATTYLVPTAGGTALKIGFSNTEIVNASSRYILGGGGGGGGGGPAAGNPTQGGGGGAGGGVGGTTYDGTTLTAGGAAGSIGGSGTSGTVASIYSSGGGAGRTVPGLSILQNCPSGSTFGGPGGQAGGGGAIRSVIVSCGGGGGGGYGATGGSGILWNNASATSAQGGMGEASGNAGTAPTVTGGTATVTNTYTGAVGGKAIDYNSVSGIIITNSGTIYGVTA